MAHTHSRAIFSEWIVLLAFVPKKPLNLHLGEYLGAGVRAGFQPQVNIKVFLPRLPRYCYAKNFNIFYNNRSSYGLGRFME